MSFLDFFEILNRFPPFFDDFFGFYWLFMPFSAVFP